MLMATKVEAIETDDTGAIRVTVAGLMLGKGHIAIKDVVCICDKDGWIKNIEFSAMTDVPDVFGERQAKHLRALCGSMCKRVGK